MFSKNNVSTMAVNPNEIKGLLKKKMFFVALYGPKHYVYL